MLASIYCLPLSYGASLSLTTAREANPVEIFGFNVPGVMLGLALGILGVYLANRADFAEEEKNERFPTLTWHQVAWHILNTRQDIRLLNLILAAILLTLWIKL
jgi:hypothetical protein